MNRRRFLYGVTAGAAMLSGCTYAPGGGDLRDEVRFPAPESGAHGRFMARFDAERFVTARSGRQWVRDESGEIDFAIATEATLVDRSGTVLWRYNHHDASTGMAVGDRVWTLGERRLVASPPIEPAATGVSLRDTVTGYAWWFPVDDDRASIGALNETAVLEDGRELVGIREAEEVWRQQLPESIIEITDDGDAFLIHAGQQLLRIRPDGSVDWRRPVAPRRGAVHRQSDGIALVADGQLRYVRDGRVRWEEPVPGRTDIVAIGDGVLAHVAGADLILRETETGRRRGTVSQRPGPEDLVVLSARGGYLARADGTVRAFDREEGIRWTRTLERRSGGPPVTGWLEPETVAIAYGGGTIYRLQREAEGRPLLL